MRNFLQVVRPFGVESFLSYLHDYNYLTRAILAAAYDLVIHVGSHYFFVASSAQACHLVLTTSEMQSITTNQIGSELNGSFHGDAKRSSCRRNTRGIVQSLFEMVE